MLDLLLQMEWVGVGGIPRSQTLKMAPSSTSLSLVKGWETNIYLLPIMCQSDSKAWQLIAEALEPQSWV